MPFYVGDYLRDTGRLTTEQHGAYLLLIFDYWVSGPLPDDDEQLASVVRLPLPAWKKLRPRVEAFFQVADGQWRHKRVDIEREKSERLTEQKANAGHASAAAKRQRKINGRSTDVATEPPTEPQRNALPSQPQSPSSEAKASGADAPPDPIKELFDSGVKILTNLGVASKSARALVGQCRKEFGADGPVFDLLLKIERDRIQEPCAYIEAAIREHKTPKASNLGRAWA